MNRAKLVIPFLLIEEIHPIGRGKTNDLNGSILKVSLLAHKTLSILYTRICIFLFFQALNKHHFFFLGLKGYQAVKYLAF